MRKYILSTGTIGTYIDDAMEDAIRHNRMKNIELSGNLLADFNTNERAKATIERIQRLVKEGVLKIASVHIPFPDALDPSVADEEARKRSVQNIIKCAQSHIDAGLGAPHYTLHGGHEPTADNERALRVANAHKSIAELAPFFQSIGASLNVENLPRTCGGNCVEEMQQMLDGQPANIGMTFDVNHFMNRAKILPDMIRTLGPRIRSFHLSDYDNVDEQHWPIPHQGTIEWHSVMRAIKELPQNINMIFEAKYLGCVDWRGNSKLDSAIRMYEYAAYYLENIEKFEATDAEFETFVVPGN